MKKFLVIGGCFALLLSLLPSGAQAITRCSIACTPTTPCSTQCLSGGGTMTELTTCGEWGAVCAGFAAADLFALDSSAGGDSAIEDALICSSTSTDATAPVAVNR
ncbi:MAG TPA: hypothetical protein VGX68_23930 [Thermoanaerobaculia bacterium]|nr:hypothetical protein [Thermoanaerobaculia bacterium]